MLLGTCAALAACGPGETTEVQSLDGDLVRQAVTTVGNWSGFGTGQCVSGVYTFYENRFGISLNGCCAQAGNVGSCEHCGACMIWESGAVQPNPALFNRYDWGTTMPQTYDIVVYPPRGGTLGYGHVACVDHLESSDPGNWGALYVMDSNYLVALQTAAYVHTVSRAPYGLYRLKSLDHQSAAPHGYLDTASCDGVTGWAQDNDAASQSINVDVYWGGVAGSGVPGERLSAGISRADLCSAIGSCTHGFAGVFPAFAAERLVRRLRGGPPAGDLPDVDPRLDRAFRAISAREARLLRRHDLPFGSSILLAAERA